MPLMPTKEMSFRLPQGFSFFGGSFTSELKRVEASKDREGSPTINLQTDKENYRPGDLVTVTVEISVPQRTTLHPHQLGVVCPFLIDNLSFEIQGVEKLDSQWFVIQKPQPGSKLKRGEHLFLECTTTSLISKVIVSTGSRKTYLVRVELPKILPPSYRGTTIRYIYYVKSILSGQWLALENGHHNGGPPNNPIQVEARIPLNIWIIQKRNILLNEDGQIDEFFPAPTIQIDAFWREKNADSEWVRANDVSDGLEEGYDSSRDETSSISSYNPSKSIDISFRNSMNLQSSASRHSISEARYSQGEPSNFPSYPTPSQLSVAEVTDEPIGEILSPRKNLVSPSSVHSPSKQQTILSSPFSAEDTGGRSMRGPSEPTALEGHIRGRSYNIRIDDQVLLRFSPKNSDSTYYFGDMIGGTLTFFHGEGSRRCLELSVTLEISENISPQFVHPSRRNSPKITKVQSDHHEVVADLLQTSFLFSIPMDGPMSFSTPYISVQWALRFEFFTTPKHVDWTRYEHPLLIDGREKGDWVLPIIVSAPASRSQSVQAKNEKLFSIGNLNIQT